MSKNISIRLNDNREKCLEALMKLPENEGYSINDYIGYLIVCRCRDKCPEVYNQLYLSFK